MLGGDHEVHRNLLLLEHDEGHLARAVPEVRGSTAEMGAVHEDPQSQLRGEGKVRFHDEAQ